MHNAETLIPFLVAIIALLGYLVLALRRISKSIKWFRKLPGEHEWLMKQVKINTDEIKNLMQILRALVEKQ